MSSKNNLDQTGAIPQIFPNPSSGAFKIIVPKEFAPASIKKGDEYRTASVQASWNEYSIGALIYTSKNDRKVDKSQMYHERFGRSNIKKGSTNELEMGGTYQSCNRTMSPVYIGYTVNGYTSRIGIDAAIVQDIVQNGWHSLTNCPWVKSAYDVESKPYYYYGYNNPYSLY